MWDLIEYLKQPSLVAVIQNHFGIKDIIKSEKSNLEILKNNSTNNTSSSIREKKWDLNKPNNNDDYIIQNKFWYYLFLIGTNLGDEIFYASFIPFWFWNIDGAVGRRVVSVWTIVMYIGQGTKDIVKWPRPSYPAKRIQKKWAEEYGMPSTHAMIAVSIPFSVLIFTMNRYIYSFTFGILFSITWCVIICISRVYFGMHTVLKINFELVSIIREIYMYYIDYYWLTSFYSPFVLLLTSASATYFFPNSGHWTPTRGDTTMVTSVWAGIHIGAWTNFYVGNLTPYPHPPPYEIIWPNIYMLGLGLLRTILGFTLVLATRNITKSFVVNVLSAFAKNVTLKNYKKKTKEVFIELTTIYATYFLVGLNTVYSIPLIFRYLGIERPTFYTEI
ncbi:sphingosine-1-phosphate phosphatase, putative [Pediculus humanus corporis]|uniref:Sphingosine-1-phosphate phosphatase, putative n=1 Tax=Pediculus humanus subsp. corporis TaxID=121224 RepID=E0VN03_PEDHC|nr:sphingosine-1-phosphate phosphatase, putative [Pediculus humanus corporis]EEB14759.1 sphingosine-1-phosphate phosphatase, putative [Pediculus humanus corporis]